MDETTELTEVALPPRYQLQTTLSESAATAVYRVFDLVARRDVAIKILRHRFSEPEELLQFKTEFATLAKLSHPNIVNVFEYGLLENGFPFFTMEYFAGKRITDFFDGQNWEALYDIVLQIASGLHHIHHLGIIHLDIKPSNILVGSSQVKLMDFGVAAESRQMFDRKIRGTLHYMAPEVLRQDRIDGRSDLYGLGMTLYETVTGALPTYGKPPIEIIRFHLEEQLRRPTAINPHIPDRLEAIILKLLEKDPRHRYPSAAALLEDVAQAAGVRVPRGGLLVGSGELLVAPLVGREREIGDLLQCIHGAKEGKGGGVLVIGPEGIGKSRMVREATLRAQLAGARVLTGRCPVNRKSIYAPFFEIFHQLVAAVNPEADPIAEIRRILRPPAGMPAEEAQSRGEKFRLYNRIVQSIQDFYGFLNVVGNSGSPLLLVIEDLQWADPSTAELLTFLVGEARHSNFLVIGTLTRERDNDAHSEDGRTSTTVWEQRARESGMTTIELGPLTEEMAREYVEALLGDPDLPPEFVRWIMWESAGSPVHIRRVIDYLIAHDYLTWSTHGWQADMSRIQNLRIPGGAAAIWMEKLEALSAEERRHLQIASVLGEHFDLQTFTALSGGVDEEVYATVRDLAGRGFLDPLADGRLYSFPQVSLREAIYGSMPARLRVETHHRAALVLEEQLSAGSAELIGQVAYHFARGENHVKGIEYSIRAGDQATNALAHEQAAEFFRVALELMDLSGDEAKKPDIRERLGDAYYRANNLRGAMQVYQFLLKSLHARGDANESSLRSAGIMKKIAKVLAKRGEHESALAYFESAMAIYRTQGEERDVAEMLNRTAWLLKERGDLAEAERSAAQASELIATLPQSPIHGYIEHTVGTIAYARGDWQQAREAFERSLQLGESTASEQLRKVATASLGNVLWKLGRWDDALVLFRRNLEQSEDEGDLWDLVLAYNNVALIEYSRGNFYAAAELFEKSIRVDEKLGSPEHEAIALEHLGESLEMLGRWGDAREKYERCINLEGFDETRITRVSVYVPLARLTSKTGDLPRALGYAHKAYEAARRARDEDFTAEAALVLAQIERERENFGEASHYVTEAISLFEHNGTAHGVARAHAFAADLAFRQQKIDEARVETEKAAEIAGRLGDRFTLAVTNWMFAKLAIAAGDRQLADEKFSAAEAIFQELDTPYEMARMLFDVGAMRDDAEEAVQALRRAVVIFEKLEATHDLDRARGALFRIRPVGKRPESSVIGLYEIVKIINSTLNVEEVLNRVLEIALRRLRAERGMIILIDPITSALRTRVARNIKEGSEGGDSRKSPQSIIREVIQSGRSVISADARADERFVDSDSVISENIVSTLCVPLVIRDRIAGAIYVDHRETRHLFSQRDLNFLEAFADQAAIAIQNARLYEEIEEARARLSLENESLRREVLHEKHLDSIVGSSEAVAKIQFTIRKASSSHSTVLLRGESGTGKGLVARIIHNVSSRRNGPFIKFNCAALPETLAESELFGHEKGAFTGADRRKLGRFELANGGTIFLDEIGKIGLAMQAKLLRVVEDKEFERVGGTQTIKTDVKIIAATNLDIERAIEEGTFREDLFYRLNIIPLILVPLRDRKEDIPQLAEHFIRKICKDLGVDTKRLAPGILDLFALYDWPGNVRELEATIHRAIVMSNGEVLSPEDFYGLLSDPHKTIPEPVLKELPRDLLSPLVRRIQITPETYEEVMSGVDRQLITHALGEAGGKIREAARRLGLARNTLKAKMTKYGITARE
jgi:Nif-specific regulatory protein